MTEPSMTIALPVSASFLADTLVAVTRAWYDQGYEHPLVAGGDGCLILASGPLAAVGDDDV